MTFQHRCLPMKSPAIPLVLVLLAACTRLAGPVPALHDEREQRGIERQELSLDDLREPMMCMGPEGQWAGYDVDVHPITRIATAYCRPPKRWVRLPVCGTGQPQPDEFGPEAPRIFAERLRDARDNSLHGDDYEDVAWCKPGIIVEGPQPPPPPPAPRQDHGRSR